MNFTQRCNMLSQYLKENKGTFSELNLGLANSTQNPSHIGHTSRTSKTTMDLFPQQSGSVFKEQLPPSSSASSVNNKSEPEASQMTIFYGGKVIVFNDFPAEKAKELMLLASKSSTLPNTASTIATTPAQVQVQAQVQKPFEPTNLVPPTNSTNIRNNIIQDSTHRPTKTISADLPIMRQKSLSRFLEKRRDRITARAPYTKPEETKSWLGLGAQGPAQLERQL